VGPPSTTAGELSPPTIPLWLITCALAILVVPISYAAGRAFPVWDDAALWFSVTEHGPAAVRAWHADRPLSALISSTLAGWGVLWTVARLVHFAAWVALAVVAAAIWRRLYPELRDYAAVPALLVVAPIFAQTQLILVNPILDAQLGSLMAFAAVLICDAVVRRPGKWAGMNRLAGIGAWTFAAVLVIGGVLLSEYALVALVALGCVFSFIVWTGSRGAPNGATTGPTLRRWFQHLAPLGVVALGAYAVYGRLATDSARVVVKPEFQLRAQGLRRIAELPPRLGFALWEATIGNLAAAAAELHLLRDVGPAIGCAVLAAVVCYLLFRRASLQVVVGSSARLGALAAALCVGLVPVILMKVSPRAGALSRLWLPLTPIAACLCAGAVLHVARADYRRKIALGMALVAGFAIGQNASATIRTRDQITALGSRIREQLAPRDLTVALFADYRFFTQGQDVFPDPDELTARLTQGWSPDERQRFWATVSSYVYAAQALPTLATVGLCGAQGSELSYHPGEMGLSRVGKVARILRVSQSADGYFLIEADHAALAPPP
jgi:hypothetical protein